MSYSTYKWDLEAFSKLVSTLGDSLSGNDIAEKIGISNSSYYKIIKRGAAPQMSVIVKIANYFGVPVDILIGRWSKEDRDKFLHDYTEIMKKLRREKYEKSLSKVQMEKEVNRLLESIPDNEISVGWPYNLLDILIQDHWPYIISEDQMDGLNKAIETLTDRESTIIFKRYVEEKTLKTCGEDWGVSEERARQIEKKALRKLRHPTRLNIIRYGYNGVQEKHELQSDISQLRIEKRLLEEELNIIRSTFEEEVAEIQANKELKGKTKAVIHDMVNRGYNKYSELEQLDLSVRSFNCLARANCRTLEDIINLAKSGTMLKLRNFGKRSLIEVLTILKERYDIDLFDIYNLKEAS